MADNIFKVVSMKKGDAQKSYTWYRNQVRNLGAGVTGVNMLRNEQLTNRLVPGEMYLFMYDPKHKATLPYYDTLPLVLPFRLVPGGFLGINLHYLPYLARFNLLGDLSELATDKKMDQNTRIKLSWQILNGSSRYNVATACVKHYLNNHLRSRFLKIDFQDWITASMLPVEKFVNEKKENVWSDTRKKYSR